jgi:CheY-like chemotaxis protein
MRKTVEYFNNVILAEDDKDQAILFRIVLKQVSPGRKLTVVGDGDQLVEALKEEVPDLIFLDLNMPHKNGYECLDEIRKKPELQEVPVVVYSSSTFSTDMSNSYLHKANLYLVKPFNSVHLRNALQSILKKEPFCPGYSLSFLTIELNKKVLL